MKKVLFVTSECAPFSKSGGLADVAGSLPAALNAGGDEVHVVSPLYACVRDRYGDQLTRKGSRDVQVGWRKASFTLYQFVYLGVTQYFLECDQFFDRPRLYGYDDDALRFAFFSHAVLDFLDDYVVRPQIIHCNDWETALTVIYLKDAQASKPELKKLRTVYTIHNIAYQGQFSADLLEGTFGLDSGWYDGGLGYIYEGRRDINLMKGAMMMADAVSTVSPNYARELHSAKYGHGLQGVADMVDGKLCGILNGIDMDLYDPSKAEGIPERFGVSDMRGKAVCKRYIQERFGLNQEPDWPLFAFVARLVEQKGIEIIKQVLPGMMDLGAQLIVYGQGDQHYADYFRWAAQRWPGQIGFTDEYHDDLALCVYAGADLYLMPSRFEPCGLSQMMAMRFGTVPVVHETGGLKDSVRGYSEFDGHGDGFSFSEYSGKYLYLAILQAMRVYFCDPETFQKLRRRCMTKDLSWARSAHQYDRMYADLAPEASSGRVAFEEGYRTLTEAYQKSFEQNRARHPERLKADYERKIEMRLYGACEGVFHIRIENGEISFQPVSCREADATIESSYDNLLDILNGKKNLDTLFLSGQFQIRGNLAKGHEIKDILSFTEP